MEGRRSGEEGRVGNLVNWGNTVNTLFERILFETEPDSSQIRVLFLMYMSAGLLLILSSDNICPPCNEGPYSPLEWTSFFAGGLLKKLGGVPELYLTGRQLVSGCWVN